MRKFRVEVTQTRSTVVYETVEGTGMTAEDQGAAVGRALARDDWTVDETKITSLEVSDG